MKYSILVLGASISISLFIRICCSLEANVDKMADLFSGRAEEVHDKFLKFKLLQGVKKEESSVVDNWIRDFRKPPVQNTPAMSKFGISPGLETSRVPINDDICGNTDPPELDLVPPDCGVDDDCICDSDDLPGGCEFNVNTSQNRTTIECIGTYEQITDIPPLPDTQLYILSLTGTQIKNISEIAFRNVTIQHIFLTQNYIEYIHPWAFHDVKDLDTLRIVGNQITYLAYEIYQGLESLTFLELSDNRISFEIYKACEILPIENITKVLPNLNWLQFTGNPLTVIPEQMFYGLRDSPVFVLYLDNCNLLNIDEDAFKFFKDLKILNLSRNPSQMLIPAANFSRTLEPLTSLTEIYLVGLGLHDELLVEVLKPIASQLTKLDISNNYFSKIKQDVLSNFPNIKDLFLDECSIREIEPNAFHSNTKLEVLSLRKNSIHQVPPYFPSTLTFLNMTNDRLDSSSLMSLNFSNLEKLRYLEISSIRMDKIPKSLLRGLFQLRNIFFTDCGVQSIEDEAFKDLQNLKVLQLNDNPISELRPEMFMGLDNLTTLKLRNCNLSFRPPSTKLSSNWTNVAQDVVDSPFKYLSRMEVVELTGNKIVHVPSNLFQNMPSLWTIYLSDNPIESWDTRMLPDRAATVFDDYPDKPKPTFYELHLQNGKIQLIKDAMLEDFRYTTVIDFTNNEFPCDENACVLRDFIDSKDSKGYYVQTWINSDNYMCKDSHSGTYIYIKHLTDRICLLNSGSGEQPPNVLQPLLSGSKTVLIISVVASLSLITAVLIILGYKNRAHLRYFWFSVKFNVMPLHPRKAKISTMDDDTSSPAASSSYDFDVFISYHHEDRKFIEDVFLPEIEIQEEDYSKEGEIIEAKNFIYFIENDAIVKSKNNAMKEKTRDLPRFKVCLHERDFAAGVPITDNIVDCVDRSRKTVIFISRKYMESQWCSYELNLAYHRLVESRRKSFVLVLMEEIPTSARGKVLNYLMVSKTYLQWPGVGGTEEEKTAFWKRLRVFLQS